MSDPSRGGDGTVEVGRRVLTIEGRSLLALADMLDERFETAVRLLHGVRGRIAVTGVGKSGHIGRKIAATFASTGAPSFFVHAGEAAHGDLGMIGADDAIVALSKSGETRELGDVVHYAKRFSIPLIAITGSRTSTLAAAATVVLPLPDAPEAAPEVSAPTTSTIMQLALGDALAVALLERRGFSALDFRVFHPGGKLGAQLRSVGDLMHGGGEVPLVSPATPMAEALLTMTQKRFGAVGVCAEDGRLIGIITDGDLRRHMHQLLDRTAGDIMTPEPITIAPHRLAAEALKLMEDRQITILFVVSDGVPSGIIHIHDLLRAGVA